MKSEIVTHIVINVKRTTELKEISTTSSSDSSMTNYLRSPMKNHNSTGFVTQGPPCDTNIYSFGDLSQNCSHPEFKTDSKVAR